MQNTFSQEATTEMFGYGEQSHQIDPRSALHGKDKHWSTENFSNNSISICLRFGGLLDDVMSLNRSRMPLKLNALRLKVPGTGKRIDGNILSQGMFHIFRNGNGISWHNKSDVFRKLWKLRCLKLSGTYRDIQKAFLALQSNLVYNHPCSHSVLHVEILD